MMEIQATIPKSQFNIVLKTVGDSTSHSEQDILLYCDNYQIQFETFTVGWKFSIHVKKSTLTHKVQLCTIIIKHSRVTTAIVPNYFNKIWNRYQNNNSNCNFSFAHMFFHSDSKTLQSWNKSSFLKQLRRLLQFGSCNIYNHLHIHYKHWVSRFANL